MFKVIPCGADKIPLIKNWQAEGSNDPEKLALWQNMFRERLTHWGVLTGPVNDLLVLDVDIKGNGFETIKTLHIPLTMSQRTPSGGAHFIFKYPKDGKVYGNKCKFLPGLDTRGTGGFICYYGTDATPIAEAPLWLLQDTVKPPPPPQGSSITVAPEIAQGIILKSLEAVRDAPEGESNNVLNVESFRLGQLVSSGSITREYAELALTRAALERGKPPYEAKATIASGLNGGTAKPLTSPFGDAPPTASFTLPAVPQPESYVPRFLTREDLMNFSKLKKPQLFENWSTEDIHITTADGGTGKTTMKLFEAICLALGERFLGFRCITPGKTLYITGEDTAEKLAAILGQILKQMGLLDDPQYDDKIRLVLESILIKKDADLCLIVKDRQGFISLNPDAMRKVMEIVDQFGPKLIVFDPISSFWGSEAALNDMNKAVTKFMSQLAEGSGASVEMINHMGKQSSNQKDMSQFAGRGGTGLPSNARVSRALRSVFDKEFSDLTDGLILGDKQTAILCNVNKFTDGSPLYNKPFLILRDGYLFSRVPLSDAKLREAEKALSDVERVFAYIKECRQADKFPTQKSVIARLMGCGDPIPKTKIERALTTIEFDGHMGEKIKLVENPDQSSKEKVFVITDSEGRE